jgi:CheY-like chemotaxis protein
MDDSKGSDNTGSGAKDSGAVNLGAGKLGVGKQDAVSRARDGADGARDGAREDAREDAGDAGMGEQANGLLRHVLLVEDEPNIAEALRFLLSREGWTVDIHADGDTALAAIKGSNADLVILDMMLPGRSGMEVLRDLRADALFADLPVLMLTARGQLRDREQAEKAGVSRFMTKPFSNTEVVTAARDLVAQARHRDRRMQQVSDPK